MQVDHIIPKTRLKAGIYWNPNRCWNMAPSCAPCNQSKSNYIDYRILVGFKNKHLRLLPNILKFNARKGESQKFSNLLSILVSLVFLIGFLLKPTLSVILDGVASGIKGICYLFKVITSNIVFNIQMYIYYKKFNCDRMRGN